MTQKTEQGDMEAIKDAASLAYSVWVRTEWDKIDSGRNPRDEFASCIETATFNRTVSRFLNELARRWGVRAVYDIEEVEDSIREIIEKYDDENASRAEQRKFLRKVRLNNRLIVYYMMDEYGGDDEDENEGGDN